MCKSGCAAAPHCIGCQMFYNAVWKLLIAWFVVGLVVTACGDKVVYTIVSDRELVVGDDIPAPQETPILTVSGRIGANNDADTIEFDVASLESLGVVEYTVMDPFEDREITYRGVLMSDLLDVLQIEEGATTLEMVALNDYQINLSVAEMYEYPVIFAMMADGVYMQPSDLGPAMIVYPYDDFRFDRAIYNSRWIWQIATMLVR